MLFAIHPLAFVLLAVRPGVSSHARLLIVFVRAVVHATIGPPVRTLAVQLGRLPVSLIMAAVCPHELAIAVNLVIGPGTLINALVRELEFTVSVLHTVDELTRVDRAVLELLAARTILQIVLPETVIFLTVSVNVGAESIGLSIHEFALVLVAIRVLNETDTMGHAVAPVTFVFGAVRPGLLAAAVLHVLNSRRFGSGCGRLIGTLGVTLNFLKLASIINVVAERVIRLIHHSGLVDRFKLHWLGDFNIPSVILEARDEAVA